MIQSAPIQVLHIAESSKGGVDTFLRSFHAASLHEMGIDNNFILPSYSDLNAAIRPDHRRNFEWRPSRLLNFVQILRLTLSYLYRRRPEVVWLHSTYAGLLRPILRVLRVPVVVYCPHGWATQRTSGARVANLVERTLWRACHKVHCISDHEAKVATDVLGIPKDKLLLLKHGFPRVNLRERLQRNGDSIKILFAGRFTEQKGVDLLLKAFKQAARADIELLLVGDFFGTYTKGYRDHVIELIRTTAGVQWLGWTDRDRLMQMMKDADCIVVPSRWEGFGLVALESLAVGTPVIASKIGGLPEIVSKDVGWVYEDQQELCAILSALSRKDLADRRARCLDYFEREFSWDEFVVRLQDFLVIALTAAGHTQTSFAPRS